MKALRKIADAVPEVRLVIVGEDDPMAHPERGSYRAELESLMRELSLEEQVIFTGFRSDIPELMAAFDVFAMPSWDEPFGMVFLEAMAMETPVVAWDSGGAPEVIANGETGFVVERGNVDALAETLLRLIRDPDLRGRMGRPGVAGWWSASAPSGCAETWSRFTGPCWERPPRRRASKAICTYRST